MNARIRSYAHIITSTAALALTACASVTTSTEPESALEVVRDGPPQRGVPSKSRPAPATPDAPPRKSTRSTAPAGAATPNLAGLPDNTASDDTMVAHFIDVGQGDATLLEFKCGAILIDTGGETTDEVVGRDRLVSYLDEFFTRRTDLARTLSLVVLSHPHIDHTDGVHGILDAQPAINILNVLDNGASSGRNSGISGQKALQNYARDTDAGYVGLAETDITTVAGVTNEIIDPLDCRRGDVGFDPRITALWGRVDEQSDWANNANNDSVIVRVDFGKASFLFTGDMQEEGIEAMLDSYSPDRRILDVDVLKVGHHGSHNATTKELVAAVSPKIAVAQSGDTTLSHDRYSAWAYGHPNQRAIKLLIDPVTGLSTTRSPKTVIVGVKGRDRKSGADPVFTTMTMSRALYDNAWDGNIAITANADGSLKVQSEF